MSLVMVLLIWGVVGIFLALTLLPLVDEIPIGILVILAGPIAWIATIVTLCVLPSDPKLGTAH